MVQRLCPSAISFANYDGRSLYIPNADIVHSPRPPRRLKPLLPITLSQARWAHASRALTQKPIVVEPAKFRVQQSLFYMTEVDEYDEHTNRSKQRMIDDLAIPSTMRSEESNESTISVRPGHDAIERQARLIADKEFGQMERNWDEYMFEHMDENTAKFIILKHVHDGK